MTNQTGCLSDEEENGHFDYLHALLVARSLFNLLVPLFCLADSYANN